MSRPNKIKGKYTPMNVSSSSNFTPTLTQVHSIEVKRAGLKIQKRYDSYTIPQVGPQLDSEATTADYSYI